MLTTLRIKNLALVSDLTLELQPGCNAVTGETGAGKSIIIGALSLMLGERADRTLIRSGEDSCSVETVFDVVDRKLRARLDPFLDENGLEPCAEDQLVLKRTFTNAGTNRQFINGSPTTLNVLASIGEWLVDMHGPHDHGDSGRVRRAGKGTRGFRRAGPPPARFGRGKGGAGGG
jgi:DNA repair protein RecN (Recombination protein N)